MEQCKVGLFNLPGVSFKKSDIPPEVIDEMKAWAKESHCGMYMTDTLWSFKTEAQRDWFVLRWGDQIIKFTPTDENK